MRFIGEIHRCTAPAVGFEGVDAEATRCDDGRHLDGVDFRELTLPFHDQRVAVWAVGRMRERHGWIHVRFLWFFYI